MEILKLAQAGSEEYHNQIKIIAKKLKEGEIIVYPTDTIYGIGGNGLNENIIGKIFSIKQRTTEKALPLLVKNVEMAEKLTFIDKKVKKILEAIWPGPITAVLWKRKIVPLKLTGNAETVALRWAKNNFLEMLFQYIDFPLISTSANISGRENIYKTDGLIKTFEESVIKPDLIIDGGDLEQNLPASTIIDLTKPKPLILRVGAVKPEELLKILEI